MTTSCITLRDHSTLLREDGGGEDVVLLHGLGLDHRMWDGVVEALHGKFRCVRYDLRWNGRAAGAPNGDLRTVADDVLDVAEYLGLNRFHLAGVSMGAAVAMTFGSCFPERLRSLTLACAPPHALPAFKQRARAAEFEGMTAQLTPTLKRWFSAATIAQDSQAVRYACARLEVMTAADWAASWRALSGFAPTILASDLRCRLIAGACDRSTPPKVVESLGSFGKDVQLDVIEGGEHMVVLEQPERFAALLADFWNDCDRVQTQLRDKGVWSLP